jgi:hypothetical protein
MLLAPGSKVCDEEVARDPPAQPNHTPDVATNKNSTDMLFMRYYEHL